MEKQAFLEELKTLVSNEDKLSINREVNELRTRFDDFVLEDERKKQVAILEAKANGEDVEYVREDDPIRNEFYEVFKEFRGAWSVAMDTKKAIQTENLKQKRSLISRLKELIANEEHIGAAFNAYKEIHETWKSIGEIEREKRAEIQAEYSRLLEDFFYNMKIYRELKEHDFHRNEQVKLEVIQKIKNLVSVESVREIEGQIKTFQNEWDEIGPVNKERWEEIKASYLEAVRNIYDRINKFYEEKRTLQADNLDKKNALLNKTIEFNGSLAAMNSTKDWEEKTQELLKIQEVWKQIGFGPKKENEEVWHLFRMECDNFFAKKKAFFDTIRVTFDAIAEKKQSLIDQANNLKTSTDWKKTSEQLITLQKRWKELGNAGQRNEQRLWKEFRAACDAFFNAKQAFYNEQDKLNETNLIAKQDLISTIENYVISENKQQAITDLKEFTNTFNAIGHVPVKEKDAIYNAYKNAIDKHYQSLKLEGEEKEKVMFQSRIETIKSSPNAGKLLEKEKYDLRKQIETLKQDIIQYENNLGFFAKSKGANEMKKEVEKKIEYTKRKIDEMARKIKMIPNE
ncbi:MAG: DUF349 domain-containing protein [Flavobacteriia bacterium]|nr:DUF349 domain-containing protein [Flavobacteriia bacterium]